MTKETLLAGIGSWLMRAVGATLRFDIEDRAGYFPKGHDRSILVAFWHNRMFIMPLFYERICHRTPPVTVLTSASRDGGLLAAFMRRFGMGAVRGSSSRRGAAALLELTTELEKGTSVAITPDGPRGPCYALGPGIAFLSQKTGAPILPLQIEYSRYWELKSWDRFRIPKPFARIRMVLHPFHRVPPEAEGEAFEAERARLESVLRAGEEPVTTAPKDKQ